MFRSSKGNSAPENRKYKIMETKIKCISQIEKIVSDLELVISEKSASGKPHSTASRKLNDLNTWIDGKWAVTLEWANDEWFDTFGTDFAESTVTRNTIPKNKFGEGFAVLGVNYKMSENMWTK